MKMIWNAAFVLSLLACGDDGDDSVVASAGAASDDRGAPSVPDRGKVPDAGPSTLCKVPTGTFMMTSRVTDELGEGCSVTSRTLSASVELSGSLQDFLSPSCRGTATWAPGSACVVRVNETCSSGDTTTELMLSSDGNSLQGTRNQRAGRCEVRASLSGTRTTSSSAATPSTPAVNTSGRLNVQLLYEDGVPVGEEGGYLEYKRYRLYANGTFESCEYQLAFGPGVVSGKPAQRNQGSYEIVGAALQLKSASGALTTVSFSYSAAQEEATIDGELYSEEKPASGAANLCDFGV